MPLRIPNLDDRSYQDLVDEALARIPVHTPEWTNFNDSDPGVTLIQLFAFLTENLLYRSNQIPERNRRKFLSLLGVPLQPGAAARGLVTFSDTSGSPAAPAPLATATLAGDLELRAGQVGFRTVLGLDVLPVEALAVYKRSVEPSKKAVIRDYYNDLYASYGRTGAEIDLYETVALDAPTAQSTGVSLGDTVDKSLWIALLARKPDLDQASPAQLAQSLDRVRAALAHKTLSLGLVPVLADTAGPERPLEMILPAGSSLAAQASPLLIYALPVGGSLGSDRRARYSQLEGKTSGDLSAGPALVQLTLPDAAGLRLWDDLEPLEWGADDFPPSLEDSTLEDRLITWLRVRLGTGGSLSLLWAGINATLISQRARVVGELLPTGSGAPDQVVTLANTPVIPDSVRLLVQARGQAQPELWQRTDDLLSAGPEVPVRDSRLPPGARQTLPSASANAGAEPPRFSLPSAARVFTLNAESGELRFGDGIRGARPPFGATLRVDYDYGAGRSGNVGVGAVNSGPNLIAGLKVSNPVPTWGGADPESVAEGERQISRYLQHRERLVTTEDYQTITRRTPGVDLGRVEVIPTFNPDLEPAERGDAPGAVTLLVIPRHDATQPDAPRPDRLLLSMICDYLEPRRMITSEIFLRGPVYKGIWISVGITVVAGQSIAEVREQTKQALLAFLAPLPASPSTTDAAGSGGWPLNNPVVRLQLWAVASRVDGVSQVNDVLLAREAEPLVAENTEVPMSGLELPRVLGIAISVGQPLALAELREQTVGAVVSADQGGAGSDPQASVARRVPVPVIREGCR